MGFRSRRGASSHTTELLISHSSRVLRAAEGGKSGVGDRSKVLMFLSTKSHGVRRLSLVLGLVGAGSYIAVRQPITNWQGSSQQFRFILYNLTEMGIGGVISFFLVWVVVRTIAWIVAGFFTD